MPLDEEREAAEKWRLRLAEPQAPLSGAQMPARAKLRLNAFCFGGGADGANSPKWPLNPPHGRLGGAEADSGGLVQPLPTIGCRLKVHPSRPLVRRGSDAGGVFPWRGAVPHTTHGRQGKQLAAGYRACALGTATETATRQRTEALYAANSTLSASNLGINP